jgi:opacity protein-like surface antigen
MMTHLLLRTRFVGIISFTVVVFFFISKECKSQDWSRSGKTEIFVLGQQMDGDSTGADALGIPFDIEVDDTFVWGLGAGYNFNDYLNLNGDIWFGSTDIESNPLGIPVKADSDLIGTDFNLDYNILKSRFTPIVSCGIGFINFDGDFGAGGSDFSETDFSYNLGAGIRWDIGDHFLVRALYKFTWTELEDTDDTLRLDGASLRIAYVF